MCGVSPTVSRRYVRCVANRISRVRVGPCWKKRSGTINKFDGLDELNMRCNFKWLSNVCFLAVVCCVVIIRNVEYMAARALLSVAAFLSCIHIR